MHIVHVTSEFAPIVKVGGLGDVLHGLSNELVRLGHTVEVILPKYDCLYFQELKNLQVVLRELWSSDGTHRYNNTVWSSRHEGVAITLIEAHHPQHYFSRGMVYGCHDDIDRFIYFSRVAMEYLHTMGKKTDIVHAHDWPTALTPVLCKDAHLALGLQDVRTVLTIHNLEYQGKCQPLNLTRVGLKGEAYLHPEKMQDPHTPTLINLLKGGIVYADHVTTVSPTYQKEVQTVVGGFGLQDTLIQYSHKFSAILNGIDQTYWNPEKDPHLIKRYQTHDVQTEAQLDAVLEAKKENKRQLRAHCNLKETAKPLVASVTRLAAQKAPHLILHALLRTLEKGSQFFLLGSGASPLIAQEFESLALKLSTNTDVRIVLDKDEALAHLIFASADMFIIPSLFEPCGLTQLISLRYGTVPIAHKTGGLADTVFDVDTATQPLQDRNGFTFDFADAPGVDWGLDRAIACFQNDPKKWRCLLLNGMHQDYSWKRAAKNYVNIYEMILDLLRN
jgi:starch synthase